jgi:hypothetical protein
VRTSLVCLLTAVAGLTVAAQQPAELVVTQSPFKFYSAFWPNLHNVLFAAAWDHRPSSVDKAGGPVPGGLVGALTEDDLARWGAALDYYDEEIADLHLLFEMGPIRKAMLAAGPELPTAGLAPKHREVLLAAAPLYRRQWWPEHDRVNRDWIQDTMARVAKLSPEVPSKLAALCGTPWITQELRVDVVLAGAREGAHTSNDPAPGHITISSGHKLIYDWTAAEVLFHEATHLMVGPMIQAFSAELKAQGKFAMAGKIGARPVDIWHPALFYMVGETLKQALVARNIKYQPYVYASGLMDRSWPNFRKPLETPWGAFVRGEISREEAIKRVVAEL